MLILNKNETEQLLRYLDWSVKTLKFYFDQQVSNNQSMEGGYSKELEEAIELKNIIVKKLDFLVTTNKGDSNEEVSDN